MPFDGKLPTSSQKSDEEESQKVVRRNNVQIRVVAAG